ncbi:helix-turn-helix domain-containing protein, partial [Jeotgalibaca porci]|uniref:helix-turn-helix domain-containing protein n=1 Tax=Jeotgalibaca porci TaxID=1868793 RepID=UPI0035A011AC
MEFGEKLKYLRESRGYGVNQLALKSGVSASQISRFESGERKDPTLETVKKLASALGIS